MAEDRSAFFIGDTAVAAQYVESIQARGHDAVRFLKAVSYLLRVRAEQLEGDETDEKGGGGEE